jgi:hypothetical protein
MSKLKIDSSIPVPYMHRLRWKGLPLSAAIMPHINPGLRVLAHENSLYAYHATRRTALHAMGYYARPPAKAPTSPLTVLSLSPRWPRTAAPSAGIALACFLEARALTKYLSLDCSSRETEMQRLALASGLQRERVEHVVGMTANAVEARLLATLMTRRPTLAIIEAYRAFDASHLDLRQLRTMKDILDAALLHGDLLPPLDALRLHARTRNILKDVLKASAPYLQDLQDIDESKVIDIGRVWTFAVSEVLLRHVKAEQKQNRPDDTQNEVIPPASMPLAPRLNNDEGDPSNGKPRKVPRLARLGKPHDPEHSEVDRKEKIVRDYRETARRATAANAAAAYASPEYLSGMFRRQSFATPEDLAEHDWDIAAHIVLATGEIPPQELREMMMQARGTDEDTTALEGAARPLARELNKILYRNTRSTTLMRRQSSGSLDGTSLATATFREAVYRKHVALPESGRGRPIVVLAGDSSSSLSDNQASLIRLLMAAWVQALNNGRLPLPVFSALYTGLRSLPDPRLQPQIHWVQHPEKPRGIGETMRALAGFTDGIGMQADALSIRHIIRSAAQYQRKRVPGGQIGTIFFVLITDAEWRKCLPTEESAVDEVRSVVKALRREYRLHCTLVVVGDAESGIDDLVDASIRVHDAELPDTAAVTRKISTYVAGMLHDHGIR